MTPDYDRAARLAAQTLIAHRITAAPIDPVPILKSLPGVLVVSYEDMAAQMALERGTMLRSVTPEYHDAMAFTKTIDENLTYIIVYNQYLPNAMIQRGLARELGHIVLGHDGSRPDDVRAIEAQTFAYHLLCPRPLIRAVQEESGVPLTTEVLGVMTGCYEKCLSGMRKTPGARVPAELNRKIREQFANYLVNLFDFLAIIAPADESRVADFGTYLDEYEE